MVSCSDFRSTGETNSTWSYTDWLALVENSSIISSRNFDFINSVQLGNVIIQVLHVHDPLWELRFYIIIENNHMPARSYLQHVSFWFLSHLHYPISISKSAARLASIEYTSVDSLDCLTAVHKQPEVEYWRAIKNQRVWFPNAFRRRAQFDILNSHHRCTNLSRWHLQSGYFVNFKQMN